MLKRNPQTYSEKPVKEKPNNLEPKPEDENVDEEPFEPIYYDLDELLKGVTPDQMQEEISTGPAVGKENF